MKKLLPSLLFLCLCGFMSCGSEDEFIDEPEISLTVFGINPESYLFFYRFSDPKGFEQHPTVENISFHEPVTIEVDEYASLVLEYQSAHIKSRKEEATEKAITLLEEINAHGSSVGEVSTSSETDPALLIGIKNNHLWMGEFNKTSRECIREWTGQEIRDRRWEVHVGYGEYENHYARYLYGGLLNVNDRKFIHTYYADNESGIHGYYGVILLDDQLHLLDFPGIENPFLLDILPWYRESALLIFHDGKQAVVKSEKEIGIYSGYYASSYTTYPVSYTQYLTFNTRSYSGFEIGLLELGKEEAIFHTYVDQYESLFEDNPIYESTYLGEVNGLFEFRVDFTYYSGEKKSLTLRIDREGNLHT